MQQRINLRGPGIFLGALILAIGGVLDSHAQDTVQNTPPELRDFRLDPPSPEAAPEPKAPEPETVPATPPTVEPTAAPVIRQPSPTVAAPQPTAPAPTGDVARDPQTAPEAAPALPGATRASDMAPTNPATVPQTDAPAPPETGGVGVVEIAALAGLLLVIAGGFFFVWNRRQLAPAASTRLPLQKTKPPNPPALRPALPRAQPVTPMPKPSPLRAMSLGFVPENAVVSFSSLTIKGELHITNASDTSAENLALSAVLVSASNEQQRAIDHFFENSDKIAPTPLGSVKPGENMSLPLKLGVALNEMQTFSLQNKTLLAPILVAQLVRLSPDGTSKEVARLVCIIGRESIPPQPKMGPLRLDQGPRSFDRLGQRALLS